MRSVRQGVPHAGVSYLRFRFVEFRGVNEPPRPLDGSCCWRKGGTEGGEDGLASSMAALSLSTENG